MNIFYASPAQIQGEQIELRGQEAIHATKALRCRVGDDITVVDGLGGWYEGKIQFILDERVRVVCRHHISNKNPQPDVILGMGIIKKRDRLEFAVEKAVELGVKKVLFFQSDYTVKQHIRVDRLQAIAISAMKQSLRVWLPKIEVAPNLKDVVARHADSNLIVAHETEQQLLESPGIDDKKQTLLLVGPEGGFSTKEIAWLRKQKGVIISLGSSRLRSETAAITLINQFNWRR